MEPPASHQSSLIQSIDIDDLFGQYRYRLRSSASLRGEDQLLLLYGDNGAGKSTILNIVYHLLNPEPYRGHRSEIGQIPFRFVKVVLTSGYTITAEKDDPFNQTHYRLQLTKPDSDEVVNHLWQYERRRPDPEDPEYMQYCRILGEIGLVFHFLSDTRRVAGQPDLPPEQSHDRFLRSRVRRDGLYRFPERSLAIAESEVLVGNAVELTIEGLRRLALAGTSVGYTSVNTIYEQILDRILNPGADADARDMLPISGLRKNLATLHERNSNYAKYGLTPILDTDRLLKLIDRAQQTSIEILNTVLKPYLDGHHARLNALEPVQKVIDEFVTMLSEFFANKSVELDVKTGLRILDRKSKEIPPELLSSGERQLVVLLCNAITARRAGMILVIDEPEISLNVKWQRRLISALLTCLEGVETQIILATHSIEILSQYQEFVTSLNEVAELTDD